MLPTLEIKGKMMRTLLILSLLLTSLPAQSQVMNSTKKSVTEVNLGNLIQAQKPTLEEEGIAREIIQTSKEEVVNDQTDIKAIIENSKSHEMAAFMDDGVPREIKINISHGCHKDKGRLIRFTNKFEQQNILKKNNFKGGPANGLKGRGKDTGKSGQSCSSCQNKDFVKESKHKESKSTDKDILVFVSSSIPKESLKALFIQAQSKGVKLVFRGLIGNSFQKTKAFFETTGINGEIDSTLFEEYQISHVPAFVLRKGEKYDILQGNISLEEVLHLIRQKGELKGKAANLLRNDQGNLS